MTEELKDEGREPEAASGEDPGAEVDRLAAEVERLEGEAARLARERDEALDAARRLRADFDNFRRRTRDEASELRMTAAADVIQGLLPVLDNLDRALTAAEQGGEGEALRQGVALTRDQFFAALVAAGLEPVPAVGQKFDPTLHEALERDGEAPDQDLEVVEEFRRGYLLRGRLLRPSLVKVASKVRRDQ